MNQEVLNDLWACLQVVMRADQTVEEGQKVRESAWLSVTSNRLKLLCVCLFVGVFI